MSVQKAATVADGGNRGEGNVVTALGDAAAVNLTAADHPCSLTTSVRSSTASVMHLRSPSQLSSVVSAGYDSADSAAPGVTVAPKWVMESPQGQPPPERPAEITRRQEKRLRRLEKALQRHSKPRGGAVKDDEDDRVVGLSSLIERSGPRQWSSPRGAPPPVGGVAEAHASEWGHRLLQQGGGARRDVGKSPSAGRPTLCGLLLLFSLLLPSFRTSTVLLEGADNTNNGTPADHLFFSSTSDTGPHGDASFSGSGGSPRDGFAYDFDFYAYLFGHPRGTSSPRERSHREPPTRMNATDAAPGAAKGPFASPSPNADGCADDIPGGDDEHHYSRGNCGHDSYRFFESGSYESDGFCPLPSDGAVSEGSSESSGSEPTSKSRKKRRGVAGKSHSVSIGLKSGDAADKDVTEEGTLSPGAAANPAHGACMPGTTAAAMRRKSRDLVTAAAAAEFPVLSSIASRVLSATVPNRLLMPQRRRVSPAKLSQSHVSTLCKRIAGSPSGLSTCEVSLVLDAHKTSSSTFVRLAPAWGAGTAILGAKRDDRLPRGGATHFPCGGTSGRSVTALALSGPVLMMVATYLCLPSVAPFQRVCKSWNRVSMQLFGLHPSFGIMRLPVYSPERERAGSPSSRSAVMAALFDEKLQHLRALREQSGAEAVTEERGVEGPRSLEVDAALAVCDGETAVRCKECRRTFYPFQAPLRTPHQAHTAAEADSSDQSLPLARNGLRARRLIEDSTNFRNPLQSLEHFKCVNCSPHVPLPEGGAPGGGARTEDPKKPKLIRLFFGQQRRDSSPRALRRLLDYLVPDVTIPHVEAHTNKQSGRGKGCAWVLVTNEHDKERLCRLNRRLFIDTAGPRPGSTLDAVEAGAEQTCVEVPDWVAEMSATDFGSLPGREHAEAGERILLAPPREAALMALAEYAIRAGACTQRPNHLPRQLVVVEVPEKKLAASKKRREAAAKEATDGDDADENVAPPHSSVAPAAGGPQVRPQAPPTLAATPAEPHSPLCAFDPVLGDICYTPADGYGPHDGVAYGTLPPAPWYDRASLVPQWYRRGGGAEAGMLRVYHATVTSAINASASTSLMSSSLGHHTVDDLTGSEFTDATTPTKGNQRWPPCRLAVHDWGRQVAPEPVDVVAESPLTPVADPLPPNLSVSVYYRLLPPTCLHGGLEEASYGHWYGAGSLVDVAEPLPATAFTHNPYRMATAVQ